MPVTATPAAPPVLTRAMIRQIMRDYAGEVANTGVLNVLLDNVEFSDSDLDNAIVFTVARYNAITPISFIQADSINLFVLCQGVVAQLLQSEALRQVRNQATVQDGDVAPIGIDDKAQIYQAMSDKAADTFTQMAQRIKIELNMESMYGGFGSGYAAVARNHHV